jgi:hypothetical protein
MSDTVHTKYSTFHVLEIMPSTPPRVTNFSIRRKFEKGRKWIDNKEGSGKKKDEMHTYAGKEMHKRDNVGNRGIRNISLWRQREEADNMVFGPKETGSSLTVASMCIFMPTIL